MIPGNLIINADDFGMDAGISRAIFQCAQEGLINSISVLPFGDAFHDDLLRTLISEFPEIRIGAHLSLLGGPPASTRGLQPLREHPDHYRDFLKLYLTGRYPAARIRAEWTDQIQRLGKYLGGPGRLAHLDSHQHVHVLPGIWPVARALQKQFGIPRLRVPYESLRRSLLHKFPFGLGLQILSRAHAGPGDARLIGFATSTRFTVRENLRALRGVLRQPDRGFELMVHPSQDREVDELRRLRDFFANPAAA